MERPRREVRAPQTYMRNEDLIEAVRLRPPLWDDNLLEYRNRDLKKRLWQEIANLFVGGSPLDCHKTWDNLRKALANHRNAFAKKYGASGSGAMLYKKYKYEDLMSFLDGFHGHDRMDSNLDGVDANSENGSGAAEFGENHENDDRLPGYVHDHVDVHLDDDVDDDFDNDERDLYNGTTDFEGSGLKNFDTSIIFNGSISETASEGQVSGIKVLASSQGKKPLQDLSNKPTYNCTTSRKLFDSPLLGLKFSGMGSLKSNVLQQQKLKPGIFRKKSMVDSMEKKKPRMLSPIGSPKTHFLDEKENSKFVHFLDSPKGKANMILPTKYESKPGAVQIESQQARKNRLKMEKQKKIADERADLTQKLAEEVKKAEKAEKQRNDGDFSSKTVEELIVRELQKEEDAVTLFLASLHDSVKSLPPKIFRKFQIEVLQLLNNLEEKSKTPERPAPGQSSIFEVSEDMLKEVEAAWNAPSDTQGVVVANYCLYGRDLHTLKNGQLLNDNIVNSYFNLIAARGFHGKSLDTYFFQNLGKKTVDELKGWASNVKQYSYLLVPVHHSSMDHWAMIFVDVNSTTLQYLDSLGGNCDNSLQKIKKFLVEETGICDWHIKLSKNLPKQKNSTDCGVFICMYANYLAAGKEFNFSQSDMDDIRRRLVYEICHGQLLPLP